MKRILSVFRFLAAEVNFFIQLLVLMLFFFVSIFFFEDVNADNSKMFHTVEVVFVIIFLIEMLLKMIALGNFLYES